MSYGHLDQTNFFSLRHHIYIYILHTAVESNFPLGEPKYSAVRTVAGGGHNLAFGVWALRVYLFGVSLLLSTSLASGYL